MPKRGSTLHGHPCPNSPTPLQFSKLCFRVFRPTTGQQIVQIAGLHLLARHHLFQRRQFENYTKNGGHRTMAGKRLIVEDGGLEFAVLNGHDNRAMSGIHGRDHTSPPLLQPDGLLVANRSAHAATEADLFVDLSFLPFVVAWVSRRNYAHRFYRTDVGTFHAAGTFVLGDGGQEVGGTDGSENGEPLGCQHSFATAPAAVADEGHALAHVLPELHQVAITGLSEQIVTFCLIHAADDAVFNQRARSGVEGHTDVHRRFAIAPQMGRLVAAIAGADADVRGRFDDFGSSFVVEHVVRVFRAQYALID